MLPLAVLNHENVLLLVFVAMAVTFGEEGWVRFSAAQLAVYAATRALQFHFLPVQRAWSIGTIWINASFFADQPKVLIAMVMQIVLMSLAVLAARSTAPPKLWRCWILLPLLLLESLIVGQMSEPRLLNAFIPIAVAMALQSERSLALRPSEGGATEVRSATAR